MIAAIEGWCVAGGLELAAWCDLRVCGEGARFGCLERRWGVPLIDGGTYRLPRIVGLGRALDLILTGREFDAAEAYDIGFATLVVPDGDRPRRPPSPSASGSPRSPWNAVRARPGQRLRGPRPGAGRGPGQRGPSRPGGDLRPGLRRRRGPVRATGADERARPRSSSASTAAVGPTCISYPPEDGRWEPGDDRDLPLRATASTGGTSCSRRTDLEDAVVMAVDSQVR